MILTLNTEGETLDKSTDLQQLLTKLVLLFEKKCTSSAESEESGKVVSPCTSCVNLKKSFKKYKLLTQRKIDLLENRIKSIENSQESNKETVLVEASFIDSSVNDDKTPKMSPPEPSEIPAVTPSEPTTNKQDAVPIDQIEEIPETQDENIFASPAKSPALSPIPTRPLVLKYDKSFRENSNNKSISTSKKLPPCPLSVKSKILENVTAPSKKPASKYDHKQKKLSSIYPVSIQRASKENGKVKQEATDTVVQQSGGKGRRKSDENIGWLSTDSEQDESSLLWQASKKPKISATNEDKAGCSKQKLEESIPSMPFIIRQSDSKTSKKDDVGNCPECEKFFDGSHWEGVKRAVCRHKSNVREALVPKEMWAIGLPDTPEAKEMGLINETLPCDLGAKKALRRRLP